jgi:pseudouridine-5'-phosphate glycosidase
LPVDERIDSAEDAALVIGARDALGLNSAILVTVPVPKQSEVPRNELESILAEALSQAEKEAIKGKELTPFLLSIMSRESGGRTLAANIALLKSNARVAAEIAIELSLGTK